VFENIRLITIIINIVVALLGILMLTYGVQSWYNGNVINWWLIFFGLLFLVDGASTLVFDLRRWRDKP
jgi:uncharacterized membrane protein HdeD (DUF308 family)